MLQVGDLYFPDEERHFVQFGDAIGEYGSSDRNAAYPYVKQWRRALDVGANVGIFSRDFATRFAEVVAFEPMPATRECLELNVPANVRIEPYAMSNAPTVLQMYVTGNSGGSFVCNHSDVAIPDMKLKPRRTIEVEARTIDSFNFDAVDLIKLDIQGAEYVALVGARDTILEHRPVILVEEKAINEEHAEFIKRTSALLVNWGMTPKERAQSDRIYIFEG